jgi:hypothetical protein
MFRRMTLSVILGGLILTASCAAEKQEEAPEPEAAKPAEPEGPFYELTKDEVTSHPDWTSKNIAYKGVKIGDKSKNYEDKLGKFAGTDPVGSPVTHYRAVGEGTKFAIYTQKMTGELEKIEIYSTAADQVADPKFKKLLQSGDLEYMRKEFGMEDSADYNPDTTAMEWSYNAKGFKFEKYDIKGTKFNGIMFTKIKETK